MWLSSRIALLSGPVGAVAVRVRTGGVVRAVWLGALVLGLAALAGRAEAAGEASEAVAPPKAAAPTARAEAVEAESAEEVREEDAAAEIETPAEPEAEPGDDVDKAAAGEKTATGATRFPEKASDIAPEATGPVRSRAAAMFFSLLEGDAKAGPSSLRRLAEANPDPLLKDLHLWRKLSAASGPGWSEVADFLARRGHWPGGEKLRARAEWAMPESLDRAEALAFFSGREPMTARGARLYGEALIADGETKTGEDWIVAGWREHVAPPSEEAIYLKKHGKLIEAHTEQRLEMLFWRNRLKAAQRLAKRLSPSVKALTAARVALLRAKGGVDRLIDQVPDTLRQHPGLTYALMVWRERKKRRADAEQAMREASSAKSLGDPEAWADERLLFAREAYEKERYQDAFDLADGHGLTEGAKFAALQWFAGWVALRHLDRPADAFERFESLWRSVSTPISRSRAAYWAWRAADAMDRPSLAEIWRGRAAAHPHAFYGQLAANAGDESFDMTPMEPPGLERVRAWSDEDRDLAQAAIALYRAGAPRLARRFLETLAERRDAPSDLRRIANLAHEYRDAAGEIEIAKAAEEKGVRIWQSLYPIPASMGFAEHTVEPSLLLAVARQESRFRIFAQSGVGALGLMQIMPATAKITAKRLKLSYDKEELARNHDYNLTLGASHMERLLKAYDGSYVLAVAAYNAGEGNVGKWLKRFGDPRDPDVDVIDWIESIPFGETRNYVQRVLEATQVYRARHLGGVSPVRVLADLARGARPVSRKIGLADQDGDADTE